MKQVLVLGLGKFGSHMARMLVRYGCEVVVLDSNEKRVDDVRDEVHRAFIGDARDPDTLKSILASPVDEAIVSFGELIEPSILCTLHLKRLNVPNIRVTATSDDHAQILTAVGCDEVIFPEQETAERNARRVANPNLLDMFSLTDDYRIMELVVPHSMVGKSLAELELRKNYDLLVLAVKDKDGEHFSFLPRADTVFHKEQIVMLMGRELDLGRFAGLE